MSSAILLISVVCCGFLHAIPYHGKRSIETDNYDYEDSDENESYDQPSMPGHRGMGDDDMAMAFFEDTVEKYEAKNGNTSQNHQFSRRSNQGNLEDAEMTINEGLPLLAGYSAENREDNDLSGSLKKSEKFSEVAELRRATVEPEGISEGPVKVLTKALKLPDPANLSTENLKIKAEILAATVDPLKIISEFRERIAAPSKSTESTTLTADPLTESSESPSDPVNKVTPVLWEKSLEASEEEFQVANVRSKEPFYSLSLSSNSSVQPKYTASVRSKNNLTLCWIETITIKEDNATSPAMRLVLREYTITLENSVSIPEDLLEYSRLEGEVHPVTKEKAMNTPFQEFFSNETQRSQVTKLKKITQEGNFMVTEEKTMRCGTGSFITKKYL
uniref:PriB protein n=1 Tax=Fopius arisanus TaxID=64838 RepID=A0A0C9RAB4_9HYME